jgi:hypothetical protein
MKDILTATLAMVLAFLLLLFGISGMIYLLNKPVENLKLKCVDAHGDWDWEHNRCTFPKELK